MNSNTVGRPAPAWERGTASEVGGRREQQDRWGMFEPPQQDGLLALLADGMGGHLDGAMGAQIVVEEARKLAHNPTTLLRTDPLAALNQLCWDMHAAINRQSENARSTVVVLWLQGDQGYWLNVGDSRLYHFRDGRRLMRTRDHSAVQLLMDMGEIDESEMATHPAQNRLYRSLGGEERPQPDVGQITIQSGDLLALCSDGVWEHVSEEELWESAQTGAAAAAPLLAAQATQRGGASADNATLLLLRAANTLPRRRRSWWQRLLGDTGDLQRSERS